MAGRKAKLKVSEPAKVPEDSAFCFNTWNGPTGVSARNLDELKHSIRNVPIESIYYHLRDDKNDFATWLASVMKDEKRAEHMNRVKSEMLEGEHLRRALYFHL